MRNVTVYSTLGNNKKEVTIQDNIRTWSQLQGVLISNGVNAEGMKAIIGQTQVTLESTEAEIPGSDFDLFLLPQKVKSGYFSDDDCGCEDDPEDGEDSSEIAAMKGKVRVIGEALNELYEMICELQTTSSDPKVNEMKSKADQLKKNLGIWE